jgi:hypothetical protein
VKARRPCGVAGCDRWARSRVGYCTNHYRRWRDKGDAGGPFLPRPTAAERFWSQVDRRGHDECWPWLGAKDRDGYGQFGIGGLHKKAHRVAYQWLRGAFPEHLTIDHLCLNTPCVNPWHMEPVTAAENSRRVAVRRTHCPKGHDFTPENTRVNKKGARTCRSCSRDSTAAWRVANIAEVRDRGRLQAAAKRAEIRTDPARHAAYLAKKREQYRQAKRRKKAA